MSVGSAAGVISGLSPGAEKVGEYLWTTYEYVPDGTTDIIIIYFPTIICFLVYINLKFSCV
jgi:hypothetical protein